MQEEEEDVWNIYLCTKKAHSLTPQPEKACHVPTVCSEPTLTSDIMFCGVQAHTLVWHVLQAAETHRCACPHPGIPWPTQAAFCPLVPTTMSHTISSCQISPVTLGQVPTHIVPLSVSRHRQLLGRVTPCYSGLQGSVVARELVVLSGKIAVFGCLFMFFLLLFFLRN